MKPSSPAARPRPIFPLPTLLLLLALNLAPCHEARAQTLQLGTPEPPELDEASAAADLARALRDEIPHLESRPRDEQRLALAADVSIALREAAVLLLQHGDRLGRAGSRVVLMGRDLASARDGIDAILARPDLPPASRVDARAFLHRVRTLRPRLGVDDPDLLAARAARALAPLAQAVARAESVELRPAWLPPVEAAASPAAAELRDKARALGVTDATLDRLGTILSRLDRALEHPELFAPALEARLRLARLLRDAARLARAEFPGHDPAPHLARVERAIALFADPATRAEAVVLLDRLALTASLVDRFAALAAPGPDRPDLRLAAPALASLESARFAAEDPARAAALDDVARAINESLALALRARRLDADPRPSRAPAPPVLARAERLLRREYLATEQLVLDEIPALLENPARVQDPAYVGLVENHRRLARDLELLTRVPAWRQAVARIAPDLDDAFRRRVEGLAADVASPGGRSASETLDALALQFERFLEFPFEDALRRPDPLAVEITMNRHEPLLQRLDELRTAWLRAASEGNVGSDAARELHALRELFLAFADAAGAVEESRDPRLARRPVWDVAAPSEADLDRARGRLALAGEAVLANRPRDLRLQLDRLREESPVLLLAGRLRRLDAARLDALPHGSTGALARVIFPPEPPESPAPPESTESPPSPEPPDPVESSERSQSPAIPAGRVDDLIDLSRYHAELAHARARGRQPLATALERFVVFTARSLLDTLPPR